MLVPDSAEAGTGAFEKRFLGHDVTPELGRISVSKPDSGICWGAVYWQHFEDVGRLSSGPEHALRLRKELFVRRDSPHGPVLEPITGPLEVGTQLLARLTIEADADMAYVHLKDDRPCGTEPDDVISQYRRKGGSGYYQVTRDASSDFYLDYLPQGVHVIEYTTHVVHRGTYQAGLARIFCMYAPEFNAHSDGRTLTAR